MNLKPGTTALQLLDGVNLDGKTAIVTGSNSGIGYEIARSLGKHGARVVMACRNETATLIALKQIKNEFPWAKIEFNRLSLDNFGSVVDFVKEFSDKHSTLHYLFLNAATFGDKYHKTVDDFEANYQVNYLSNALLVLLLKDILMTSAPSRVVFTSTVGHSYFNMRLEDIKEDIFKAPHDCWGSLKAYSHSKLLCLAFANQMSALWSNEGVSFYAFDAAHTNGTNLMRHWWLYKLFIWLTSPFNYTKQQAAAIAIYCVISPTLQPDKHFFFSNYKAEMPFKATDSAMKLKTMKVTMQLLNKAGVLAKI